MYFKKSIKYYTLYETLFPKTNKYFQKKTEQNLDLLLCNTAIQYKFEKCNQVMFLSCYSKKHMV